ncbi:sugar phosphate isomerase/epimerase [Paenibacillaceae bacterium]|nr:sugar phosphate isomerase/epimerase [Paenibacillaceae bacterium]
MRLGGPVESQHPDEWVKQLLDFGYTAATLPLDVKNHDLQDAFGEAARQAGIVLAEVGAWSNPISLDETERATAIALCQEQLATADRIGALCCVNIAGSRGKKWDGPYAENFSEDTFALIVDTVREIIDAVKPSRAVYALETMPWIFPYDVDSYLRLIKAIERPQFAVHLDPVNLISSIDRYFNNAALLKECFTKLGAYIVSCHAKDVRIQEGLTLHIDETRPGTGVLDYYVYLEQLSKLSKDTPLILEHLPNEDEYRLGAEYIRKVAGELNIAL